ncbi:hypothetical protein BDAP_000709 [Binucleata daphniae]
MYDIKQYTKKVKYECEIDGTEIIKVCNIKSEVVEIQKKYEVKQDDAKQKNYILASERCTKETYNFRKIEKISKTNESNKNNINYDLEVHKEKNDTKDKNRITNACNNRIEKIMCIFDDNVAKNYNEKVDLNTKKVNTHIVKDTSVNVLNKIIEDTKEDRNENLTISSVNSTNEINAKENMKKMNGCNKTNENDKKNEKCNIKQFDFLEVKKYENAICCFCVNNMNEKCYKYLCKIPYYHNKKQEALTEIKHNKVAKNMYEYKKGRRKMPDDIHSDYKDIQYVKKSCIEQRNKTNRNSIHINLYKRSKQIKKESKLVLEKILIKKR